MEGIDEHQVLPPYDCRNGPPVATMVLHSKLLNLRILIDLERLKLLTGQLMSLEELCDQRENILPAFERKIKDLLFEDFELNKVHRLIVNILSLGSGVNTLFDDNSGTHVPSLG